MSRRRQRPPRQPPSADDRSYPAEYLGGTAHEWRQMKRQEWKAVLDALSRFEVGSAYTPAGADLYYLRREADRIWDNLQGEWIAWLLVKPQQKRRRPSGNARVR
jgi:hypothetical protein